MHQRSHSSSSKQSSSISRIEFSLTNPSLTVLHRAGLAGLWMTLRQLEQQCPIAQVPCNLRWSLSPRSITLQWEGSDFAALDWLLNQSFQVSNDGLTTLIGLGPQAISTQAQLAVHQGITGTFLQHNKFLKSAGRDTRVLKVGDEEITVKYKRVVSYAHQNFATVLCDARGSFCREAVGIAGWLYPGAIARHARFGKKTKFEETAELAFALLFAPIACWYFILSNHSQKGSDQYALVIPEVDDLEQYATRFWELKDLNYLSFYVSGMEDAGLKFLSYQNNGKNVGKSDSRQCQVISFGQVDWSSQQRTRTEVITVKADEEVLREYQRSCEIFEANKIVKHSNWQSVVPSYAHRIITENLARGCSWWAGFSAHINDRSSRQAIFREWNGLLSMVENTQWDHQTKRIFVKACHEALRRTYAKVYSRTAEDEYARIEQKNQRFISELNRCKDIHTFRHFIHVLFAKAGLNSFLEEHWEDLLPLMTGEGDWRVARDLFLLAIASYPKSKTLGAAQTGNAQEVSRQAIDRETTTKSKNWLVFYVASIW